MYSTSQLQTSHFKSLPVTHDSRLPLWIVQGWTFLSLCQACMHFLTSTKAGEGARKENLCALHCASWCSLNSCWFVPNTQPLKYPLLLYKEHHFQPWPWCQQYVGQNRIPFQTFCFHTIISGHVLGPSPWAGWILLQLSAFSQGQRILSLLAPSLSPQYPLS